MEVEVAARENCPSTKLFAEIITSDSNQLGANGRSVMILAPGGPGGNHMVYESIKEKLLPFADLVLFDPRGCGLSDQTPAEFCTLDNYVEDIEALRKKLNLQKFTLLGGSYGAIASLKYATKYSNNLDKLIVVSGGMADSSYLETVQNNLRQRGTPEQIAMGEHLWNGSFRNVEHFEQFYKTMAPLYIHSYDKSNNDNPPTTKSNLPCNVEITNLGFKDFLRHFDFNSELNKINCETLIINGADDWISDLSLSKKTAAMIKNSTLVILKDCSHFIWLDQPDAFFQSIRDFMCVNKPDTAPKATSDFKLSFQ